MPKLQNPNPKPENLPLNLVLLYMYATATNVEVRAVVGRIICFLLSIFEDFCAVVP